MSIDDLLEVTDADDDGRGRDCLQELDKLSAHVKNIVTQLEYMSERLARVEVEAATAAENYVADLKDQLKVHEERDRHWVRYAVATIVTLALAVGTGVLGYITAKPR